MVRFDFDQRCLAATTTAELLPASPLYAGLIDRVPADCAGDTSQCHRLRPSSPDWPPAIRAVTSIELRINHTCAETLSLRHTRWAPLCPTFPCALADDPFGGCHAFQAFGRDDGKARTIEPAAVHLVPVRPVLGQGACQTTDPRHTKPVSPRCLSGKPLRAARRRRLCPSVFFLPLAHRLAMTPA